MRWRRAKKNWFNNNIKKKLVLQQQHKKKILVQQQHKKKMGSTKKLLGSKKTFDTRDSRVVPHRSTDRAQPCLTSQFGWDAVYPRWCDRMMRSLFFSSMLPLHSLTKSEEVNVSIFQPRTGPCWCSW